MKRIMIGILATAVIFMGGTGFAASMPFDDIEKDDVAVAVKALYEMGMVSGVAENAYAPDRLLTNAEGIQLIVNALNLNLAHITFIKAPEATDYFKNADNDAWYADGLIIAAANGLDLSPDLNPSAIMTREDFIYQLVTAFEMKYQMPLINLVPADFSDESLVNPSYTGSIQRALHYGVITLDADNAFNPNASVTRGDAAVFVKAMYDYTEDQKDVGAFGGILVALSLNDGFSINFLMENKTGEDQTITFSSGQRFDYTVYAEDGSIVYQWAKDKAFTMSLVEETFEADKIMLFEDTWPVIDNDGAPLPAGEYRIVFTVSFYWNELPVTVHDTVPVQVTR